MLEVKFPTLAARAVMWPVNLGWLRLACILVALCCTTLGQPHKAKRSPFSMDRLRNATVEKTPFPYMFIEQLVHPSALTETNREYPAVLQSVPKFMTEKGADEASLRRRGSLKAELSNLLRALKSR